MGQLITIEKKAQEAGDSVMSAYHSDKQKGLAKWKKYLKSKNPDCYVIQTYIVVRLDTVSDKNASEALDTGDIVQDKTGAYYGVITEMDASGD